MTYTTIILLTLYNVTGMLSKKHSLNNRVLIKQINFTFEKFPSHNTIQIIKPFMVSLCYHHDRKTVPLYPYDKGEL